MTVEPSKGATCTGTPTPPRYIRLASGSATTPKIGPEASHSAMLTANPDRFFKKDSVPWLTIAPSTVAETDAPDDAAVEEGPEERVEHAEPSRVVLAEPRRPDEYLCRRCRGHQPLAEWGGPLLPCTCGRA